MGVVVGVLLLWGFLIYIVQQNNTIISTYRIEECILGACVQGGGKKQVVR